MLCVLCPQVMRWEIDTGSKFDPSSVDLSKATNVLDR